MSDCEINRHAVRAWRSMLVGVAFLIMTGWACAAPPLPLEKTVSFELLRMESDARPISVESEKFLRKILMDALTAAGSNVPTNENDFLDFAKRVSISFARNNFIQPILQKDWTNSLGESLAPVAEDHPRAGQYLDHSQNLERRPYIDPSKPLHFLDCDMAALLLMSVAQMAGFELNLVEVPYHNFVRWQGPDGQRVNWDWTYWGSHPDSFYIRQRGISEAQLLRKAFLQSQSAEESRGYFIGVMAIPVQEPAKRLALRRAAIKAAPSNATTANNAAWTFATIEEGITEAERQDAVVFALTAWATNPGNANYIDTVACSFGARGQWEMAVALETQAARMDPAYQENVERLQQRELCAD